MSERHFPVDAIGNRIKEGSLVHIAIPQSGTLAHVVKVEQAGVLSGPDGKAIAMDGRITVALSFPYRPGVAIGQMLAVKQPDTEPAPRLIVNDKEAAEVLGERKN